MTALSAASVDRENDVRDMWASVRSDECSRRAELPSAVHAFYAEAVRCAALGESASRLPERLPERLPRHLRGSTSRRRTTDNRIPAPPVGRCANARPLVGAMHPLGRVREQRVPAPKAIVGTN